VKSKTIKQSQILKYHQSNKEYEGERKMKTKWKEIVLEVSKADEQLPLVDEINLLAHDRETGVKAIVDRKTMDTICVVKNENQIVQHNNVVKEVLKLENYTIRKITLMQNGQMLLVDVTERTPKKIELLPKDYLECGARVINDYTKNKGLSVQGSAIRLVCENGLTAPTTTGKVAIEAFGTADFSKELESKIDASFKVWEEHADLFKNANSTVVSVKDILQDHSFLPKKEMEEVIVKLKDKESLYNIWNEYTRIIQHNLIPKKKTIDIIGLQKRANKILQVVVIPE